MWFTIHYVTRFAKPHFYRVFPKEDKLLWRGFGDANSKELEQHLQNSTPFRAEEIELIIRLWVSYVHTDAVRLVALSKIDTGSIRFLPEVIQAHLERRSIDGKPGRPQQLLQQIIDGGITTFPEIFSSFSKQDGIYGFGDLQIHNMLEEIGYTHKEEKVKY
jgi:hypothetical protein